MTRRFIRRHCAKCPYCAYDRMGLFLRLKPVACCAVDEGNEAIPLQLVTECKIRNKK